jgi:exodeoxyribonuclease-3
MENLAGWLDSEAPDVVLLQEIKSDYAAFPFFDLQTLGYNAKILGQKSYNGVAVLSRYKIEIAHENLPNFKDENSRYLEAVIHVKDEKIRVASAYFPNGNPPYNNPDDNSKFDYKLKWMEAMYAHAKDLLSLNEPVILGGDFNVIITNSDVYDPEMFKNNALMREEVRQRLKAIEYLGFYDAFRTLHPKDVGYTFWDYSGNAFNADLGMRIDYILLSPILADRLSKCYVDKNPRGKVKPSDHTPLIAELK